mgnify:CR=1 FL=1
MDAQLLEDRELAFSCRAYLYKLFSHLYAEPLKAELLGILWDEATAVSYEALCGEVLGQSFKEWLDLIQEQVALNQEQWLEEADKHCKRLFEGPGSLLAAPWASVYQAENPILFQASTLAVRAYYQAEGLAVEAGDSNEPDDHISLELAFMAHLAEKGKDLMGEEAWAVDGQAHQFIREQLLSWLPAFKDRVEAAGLGDFYGPMTAFMVAFLEADEAYLSELLEKGAYVWGI